LTVNFTGLCKHYIGADREVGRRRRRERRARLPAPAVCLPPAAVTRVVYFLVPKWATGVVDGPPMEWPPSHSTNALTTVQWRPWP